MAKSRTTPEAAVGRSSGKSSPIGTTMMTHLMFPNSFSELEMQAIELLVQLSTTTSGGGSACEVVSNDHRTENEESTGTDAKSRAAAIDDDHHDQVSLSLSSSPPPPSSSSKSQTEDVDRVDEDEVSLGLGPMRKKRFRSISELYELTELLHNLNRKRKRTRMRMSGHASSR